MPTNIPAQLSLDGLQDFGSGLRRNTHAACARVDIWWTQSPVCIPTIASSRQGESVHTPFACCILHFYLSITLLRSHQSLSFTHYTVFLSLRAISLIMFSLNTPLQSLTIVLLLGCPLTLVAQGQNSACLIAERFEQRYTVREQAVSVNTNVLTNTTFYPIPQAAIAITNAPTSIDTITTFRWTEAQVPMSIWSPTVASSTVGRLSSMVYTSAMATAYPDLGDYYVIAAMNARNVQKRQGNGAVRESRKDIPTRSVRRLTCWTLVLHQWQRNSVERLHNLSDLPDQGR